MENVGKDDGQLVVAQGEAKLLNAWSGTVGAEGSCQDIAAPTTGAAATLAQPMQRTPEQLELTAKIDGFCQHLEQVAGALTAEFARLGMGITVDAGAATATVRMGAEIGRAIRFADQDDRSGVLHAEQIRTAVEAMYHVTDSPDRPGLIIGAMQSGKTTTSLALSFMGPVNYVVNGTKLFPIYLTTSQNGHENQARDEFAAFLSYYQDLQFRFDERACTLRQVRSGIVLDASFDMSPNLATYRNEVLRPARELHWKQPTVDELVKKRVRGSVLHETVRMCKRMHAKGFVPMFIIDEPQWGAGNRVEKKPGQLPSVKDCVLLQLVKALRREIKEMGPDDFPRFVGMSATPYELGGVSEIWQVYQKLGPAYRGFNWFNGRRIDPAATIRPPQMASLGEMSRPVGNAFLQHVRLDAYSRVDRFRRLAAMIGYAGGHADYRADCAKALHDLIMHLVRMGEAQTGGPIGLCLRGLNDNTATEALQREMNLPQGNVERIGWYGDENKGLTVRDAIRRREHPDRSFLVPVTSKARMGDAFPRQVRYFIDLTQKSSTQNALLQGLLGRACGYGKDTLVVMSEENVAYARAVAAGTPWALRPCTQVKMVDARVGIRSAAQVVLRRGVDPVLDATFFNELDAHVVAGLIPDGPTMRPRKAGTGGRRGAIYTMPGFAEVEAALADLDRRAALLPDVAPEDALVAAKPGDTVERIRRDPRTGAETRLKVGFLQDAADRVHFTFRRVDQVDRGGTGGRGLGRGQTQGQGPAGDHLDPQLGMAKIDAAGNIVSDVVTPGRWQVQAIALPLRFYVRVGAMGGQVPLPADTCVYDGLLTPAERALRDAA